MKKYSLSDDLAHVVRSKKRNRIHVANSNYGGGKDFKNTV